MMPLITKRLVGEKILNRVLDKTKGIEKVGRLGWKQQTVLKKLSKLDAVQVSDTTGAEQRDLSR